MIVTDVQHALADDFITSCYKEHQNGSIENILIASSYQGEARSGQYAEMNFSAGVA